MTQLAAALFAPGGDGGPGWLTGPLNGALWQFLYWVGQGFWFVDRSLLQFAVQLHNLRKIVSDPGGITQTALETILRGSGSPITGQLVVGMLQAALVLFVIGLALRAHNWDFEWVSPKKIILFVVLTGIVFQTGSLYFTKAEEARTWLQEGAHTIGAAIGQNISADQTNHEVPTGPLGPPPQPIFPTTTALFANDPNYSGVTLEPVMHLT